MQEINFLRNSEFRYYGISESGPGTGALPPPSDINNVVSRDSAADKAALTPLVSLSY